MEKLEDFMFEGLIIPLLMMHFRGADREDIVMLTLRYDNFQEFMDEQGKYFDMLKVLTEKEIVTDIVKLYIKLQIKNSLCQYNHTWNLNEVGDFQKVEEVIDDCVDKNKDALLNKVKNHFKQVYDKYCENILKSDNFNIFRRLT
jgi:hypothetical protein